MLKDWNENSITPEQIKSLIKNKIAAVSFDSIREDVVRFVNDDRGLVIWSPKYFEDLVDMMKFE